LFVAFTLYERKNDKQVIEKYHIHRRFFTENTRSLSQSANTEGARARLRAAVLVVLCLIFGALASFLAGELEVSMAFISVDTVLVFVGALLAVGAVALYHRRMRATR
jgi:hypothetical protein